MPPSHLSGRGWRTVVVIAAAVAALTAGCTGGEDAAETSGEAATSSPNPKVRLTEFSAPHPIEGDCHDLTAAQVGQPYDSTPTTACRKPHTTQTFYVGTFNLDIIGDRTPNTAAMAEFVTPRCTRKFTRWVGGDHRTRVLSRAHPVWFVPSARDIRLGARWFRCDLVLSGVKNRLQELPRDTEGLLESWAALDEYGLCSRGSPERSRSEPVICSRSHSWQAFAALRVQSRDSESYPSTARLRDARDRCRRQARRELNFPLEWHYGWQSPTREQWRAGLQWGVCWVPRD